MRRAATARCGLALGSVLLVACGAATQGPSDGPAPKKRPPAEVLEVSEETVCEAEALKPLRAAAGTPPPEEVTGPVADVIIEGLDGKQGQLRATLSSRPGERLDPDKVSADIEKLWATGRFEDISVEARTSGGGTILAFVVAERPTTGKLFFRGVHQLPKQQVEDAVQLRAGELYDPQQLTFTVARLREAYSAAGYWFATVDVRELRTDALHLCLRVKEGAKVTIDQWSFEGIKLINEEQVRALMDSRDGTTNVPGGVYRPEIWERDALHIQAHYWNNGFILAKIAAPDVDISEDQRKVTVTIRIDEGVVFRVGKISFSGDALAPGQHYASAITTKSGEIFSRAKMMEDLARIREFHEKTGSWTPQFEVIPVTQVDTDKSLVHVDFELR